MKRLTLAAALAALVLTLTPALASDMPRFEVAIQVGEEITPLAMESWINFPQKSKRVGRSKMFIDYRDPSALIRAAATPHVLVKSTRAPNANEVFLVRLATNSATRRVEVAHPRDKKARSGPMTADNAFVPASATRVAWATEQSQPGVWRMTPTSELEPGEYALYFGSQRDRGKWAKIFAFGVDARPETLTLASTGG